jgi:anti-sigma regulatory factor (Ser/Thr protein kinase)
VSESLQLRVPSAIDAIAPASGAAEAWLGDKGASPDAAFLVSLAIEELVTNCIKYGYDDGGDHVVDITLSLTKEMLTMVVVDDGRAFNPLELPPPDTSMSIEDRPIGGLGIHLLRQMSDDMQYERRDSTNRLTLIKRLS